MEWNRQAEIHRNSQDDCYSESTSRGHRRHSLLILEGNSSPSFSTSLNDNDALLPDPQESYNGQKGHRSPLLNQCSKLPAAPTLMEDISRCQDQVEELIQLFTTLSTAQQKYRGIDPTLDCPKSRIPRLKTSISGIQGESYQVQRSIESIHDLENARSNLEQSLEDALHVLDQFSMANETHYQNRAFVFQENTELSTSVPNQKIHFSNEDPDLEIPSSLLQDNLNFESQFPSKLEELMELSLFEESDQMLNEASLDPSPSNEQSAPNKQTFRVLFPDPIGYGSVRPTSRCSSQNLSGLESASISRTRPRIERDALSETNDDFDEALVSTRRTKSALSVLFPQESATLARSGSTLPTIPSIALSSDWDLLEGGFSFLDGPNPCAFHEERLPGEDPFWALNSASYRPPADLCESALDGNSPKGGFPVRIDQSVQCDFHGRKNENELRVIESSGCVPSLFRKRKQQNDRKTRLTQMMISASFLSRAMTDSTGHGPLAIPARNGMLCGIRTAMKQAFRPPRQPKQQF